MNRRGFFWRVVGAITTGLAAKSSTYTFSAQHLESDATARRIFAAPSDLPLTIAPGEEIFITSGGIGYTFRNTDKTPVTLRGFSSGIA